MDEEDGIELMDEGAEDESQSSVNATPLVSVSEDEGNGKNLIL